MKQKLLIVMMALLLPVTVCAYDVCVDGIYYNVIKKAKQATVTYGDSETGTYSGDVVIPATIVYDGVTYDVVAIGENAFKYHGWEMTLNSLSIPAGITKIEEGAFDLDYSNNTFSSLYISDIASWCNIDFADENAHPNKTSPYNPLECASNLYVNNQLTTDLIIPEGVTEIKPFAFRRAKILTSITLPNSLTKIGKCAFQGCTGLTSIVIPDNVTTIGYQSFEDCTGLTTITVGSGVTETGTCAFKDCVNIDKVYYNSDLKSWLSIDFGPISVDTGLGTGYEGPSHPLHYANHFYIGGSEVKDLVIPDGIEELSAFAFSSPCFTSLVIPDGVKELKGDIKLTGGYKKTSGCTNLKTIKVGTGLSSLSISNLKSLTSVEVGYSSTRILIADCNQLTNLDIKEAASLSIYRCNNIKTLQVPDGVMGVTINGADELTTLILGKSVSTLQLYKCKELTDVYCPLIEPIKAQYSHVIFSDDCQIEYATLHVPESSVSAYQSAEVWSNFGTIVALKEGDPGYSNDSPSTDGIITFADSRVAKICINNWDTNGDGKLSEQEAAAVTDLGTLFKDNTQISSFNELKYFTGLTTLGDEAFYNCTGLTSIEIPEGVTTIGKRAFYYCSSLQEAPLHDGITTIGSYAFAYCNRITELNIPKNITKIPEGMYAGCSGLKRIDIPNHVIEIGEKAFSNLTGRNPLSYEQVTIPNSVKKIGECAFSNTVVKKLILGTGLTEFGNTVDDYPAISFYSIFEEVYVPNINIWYQLTSFPTYIFSPEYNYRLFVNGCEVDVLEVPQGTAKIEAYQFAGCASFTSVIIPSSVTEIGRNAFLNCSSLKDIYCPIENPFFIFGGEANPFYGVTETATLHVPKTSVDLYKKQQYWNMFTNIVALEEGDPGYDIPDDVNGDKSVNAADIIAITNYIAGNPSTITLEKADINGDGVVNITDIIQIVNIIMGEP